MKFAKQKHLIKIKKKFILVSLLLSSNISLIQAACSSACINGGSCTGLSDYCDCPNTHYGQICEFSKTDIRELLSAAAPNLVGFWPFTYSMGVQDAAANAINGIMVSNITYETGPYDLPATSIQTMATPTPAYVYFDSWLLDYDATASPWTWGTWIYSQTSDVAYFHLYVSSTTTSSSTYLYQVYDRFYFYSSYGSDYVTCKIYYGWAYVAVTFNPGAREGRFYCFNKLSSTIMTTTSNVITERRVFLGYRPSTAVGYSIRYACMSTHKAILSETQITNVKNMCKYFSVTCPDGCANGGTCIGYRLCQCAAGWSGTKCTTFTCSPSCLNGQACSGPNTCSCNASYTGSICQTPVCSQACEYGNCTAPNFCTCYGGFSGASCNISLCSPDCINGGSCFGSECMCLSNYVGKYCQIERPIIQDVLAATSSNLVAYWPLNNDFGVNDAYAYQINGTVSTTMTYTTGPYSKSQSAIITSFFPYRYVTFGSNLLDVGANGNSWTLAMWIKTPSTTSAPIWHFYSPTSNLTEGLQVFQNTVNTLSVKSSASSMSWSCTMSGVWQFVALSYLSFNKTVIAFCNSSYNASTLKLSTNPLTYSRVYMGYRPKSPSYHTFNFACASLHSASLTIDQLLAVKDACKYFTVSCASACSNGGSCVGSDVCKCPNGYHGNQCESASCNPTCLNGGSCSGPNQCSCAPGYSGTLCDSGICSPTCQHGNCTGPNVCSCEIGWTSPDCSSAICSQTCLNGGSCSSPNLCTCLSGYTGSDCETAICNFPCQHGGNCTSPNTCICASGWTGAACEEAICTPGCQNGGSCINPETCLCLATWSGASCEREITTSTSPPLTTAIETTSTSSTSATTTTMEEPSTSLASAAATATTEATTTTSTQQAATTATAQTPASTTAAQTTTAAPATPSPAATPPPQFILQDTARFRAGCRFVCRPHPTNAAGYECGQACD